MSVVESGTSVVEISITSTIGDGALTATGLSQALRQKLTIKATRKCFVANR